jgi:hypothetical protein
MNNCAGFGACASDSDNDMILIRRSCKGKNLCLNTTCSHAKRGLREKEQSFMSNVKMQYP